MQQSMDSLPDRKTYGLEVLRVASAVLAAGGVFVLVKIGSTLKETWMFATPLLLAIAALTAQLSAIALYGADTDVKRSALMSACLGLMFGVIGFVFAIGVGLGPQATNLSPMLYFFFLPPLSFFVGAALGLAWARRINKQPPR